MILTNTPQPFETIQLSDYIQILGLAISIIIALTGFIFSTISIKQTQKTIEEANRPNLIIYNDYQIIDGHHEKFFIITNIGSVPAKITSLEFDKPLDELNNNRFDKNLVNTVLAPGQILKSVILNDYYELLHAKLTYERVPSKPYQQNYRQKYRQSQKKYGYVYETTLKTDMSKYLFYNVYHK